MRLNAFSIFSPPVPPDIGSVAFAAPAARLPPMRAGVCQIPNNCTQPANSTALPRSSPPGGVHLPAETGRFAPPPARLRLRPGAGGNPGAEPGRMERRTRPSLVRQAPLC